MRTFNLLVVLLTLWTIVSVSLFIAFINTRAFIWIQLKQETPAKTDTKTLDIRSTDRQFIDMTADGYDVINAIQNAKQDFFPEWYWSMPMDKLATTLNKERRKAGAAVLRFQRSKDVGNVGNWGSVDGHVRQYSLYNPDDAAVKALMADMRTLPFETAREKKEGTQLKLEVKFHGGGWALLKPMRMARYNASRSELYERHFAEVAAFHLDRRNFAPTQAEYKPTCCSVLHRVHLENWAYEYKILGYYRVPPTVGRNINMTSELFPVAPDSLLDTVYISADGNTCFNGHCNWCGTSFCGSKDRIEVSLMYFLPTSPQAGAKLRLSGNSWFKLRKGKRQPGWISRAHEVCNQTKLDYMNGNYFLLDQLDVHYFDSLIDNIDRHAYGMYKDFKNDTIPILFDNGRSFGNPKLDTLLDFWNTSGCCLMKKTTFLKYLKLFMGPEKLSDLMRESLRSDAIHPVLPEDELLVLDRRVVKTISYIQTCLEKHNIDDVIIDDLIF